MNCIIQSRGFYFAPKKRNLSSLETIILILDMVSSIVSIFILDIDLIVAYLIYYDKGTKIFIIFLSCIIFKYSSLIYNWVIYGIYECNKSFSKCFKKASIIVLSIYFIFIFSFVLLFIIRNISDHPSWKQLIVDIFNYYSIPHFIILFQIGYNIKFLFSEGKNVIDDIEI